MSPAYMESVAEGYTLGSIATWIAAVISGAVYADGRSPSALVVAVGFAAMALVAARRRAVLLRKAEEIRTLEKAGLD